jgi:tellurite methyltransferase
VTADLPSLVSPFVAEWLPRVAAELGVPAARRVALDLAMGEGRHARALARAGFVTFGVDLAFDRLQVGKAEAAERGLDLRVWASDLERDPLPRACCDLLLCTRFLLRHRWNEVKSMVRPGGFVMYETFTTAGGTEGIGPRSPEHLLRPGELLREFAGWRILHSHEIDDPMIATASLVAQNVR